jgi:protein TonB
MKPIILAVFISIAIHFLILNNYKIEQQEIKSSMKNDSTAKTEVTYVQLKKAQPKTEQKPEPIKEIKPEPKKIKKPIEKPKPKPVEKPKVKPKPIPKKIEKIEKKPEPKKIIPVKKPEIKKPVEKTVKKEIPKKTIQEKTLEKFLAQEEKVDKETLDTIERLYGKEFETFTKVQKAFIKDNINKFGIITQRVLSRMGYPRLAAKLGIGGVNVVEFTLFPDGSIKGLKISESSDYTILDDYTLELIEIAYKDYPKPKTPTKLKFNVMYRLY